MKGSNEVDEFANWLESIGIGDVAPALRSIGIKNMKVVKHIEESDLEGLKPFEKKVLLREVKNLQLGATASADSLHNNVTL